MGTTEGLKEVLFAVHPSETHADAHSAGRTGPEAFSVRVADSLQSIEELRSLWMKWATRPETDFDCYLHSLKNDPMRQPFVITVYEGANLLAMLVGQIRQQKLSTVVSFIRVGGHEARMLEILAGGRMGQESTAIDKVLALRLRQTTQNAEVDLICFQRLPLRSSLFHELQNSLGPFLRERIPHRFTYSVIPLVSASGERPEALAGKNRREVRRKTRILQRAFPGEISFRCFLDPGELEEGLQQAAGVAVTSWQGYTGVHALSLSQVLDKFKGLEGAGRIRTYLMYIEGKPVAFLIGQHFRQTFYCREAGYNFEFSRFSIGSLLTYWALENLFVAGVEQVDLGEGSQEHHRRLGCKVSEEGTVHLYAPSVRGLGASLFFGSTMAIRAVGRQAQSRLRLDQLAQVWSQRLIQRRKFQLQSTERDQSLS
jgi:hypothetical protein